MCRRAARVHDPFGNALVIEVSDLLAQDEVFEQRRPTQSGLERVLVVRDRNALIGRQRAVGGIHADAVERTDGRVMPNLWSSAAGLLRTVHFAHRAGADDGVRRLHRGTGWRSYC